MVKNYQFMVKVSSKVHSVQICIVTPSAKDLGSIQEYVLSQNSDSVHMHVVSPFLPGKGMHPETQGMLETVGSIELPCILTHRPQ